MNVNGKTISAIFEKVRIGKPLVHHITNWVTIYDCANMTRAFGALPVMAHAREEAAEMAAIASALVLNIGTLTPELVDSMIIAGRSANKKGIPVVLDAVGVGATKLRDNEALRLLKEIKINIIKGNSSAHGLACYGIAGELAAAKSQGHGSFHGHFYDKVYNLD